MSSGWSEWSVHETTAVFGDGYFARSKADDGATQLRYELLEQDWYRAGQKALPGYFARFGLPSAASA